MKRFCALPTRTESHPDILGALVAAPASSTASEPHLRTARHEDDRGQDARISNPVARRLRGSRRPTTARSKFTASRHTRYRGPLCCVQTPVGART
jgi:hypothetical protein